LSTIAEFARTLHETNSTQAARELTPMSYPSAGQSVKDIRALIFDVYGTLFNYWKPAFVTEASRTAALLDAFSKTIAFFNMAPYITAINPADSPEKTLSDFYHGLIAIKHNVLQEKGIEFPEVKIEEVWQAILLMLKRRGYRYTGQCIIDEDDLPRCMAYYYNFCAHNRGLYPGVYGALQELKKNGISLGILSNAQFYTVIDLTLNLREQSNNALDDAGELFDRDLMFFSFEYAMAKPGHILFRRLFDALYEYQILPSQVVFVGNDLASDIKPAQEAGMKTALFTGDAHSLFLHDLAGEVIPDISFSSWSDLPRMISLGEK